MICDIIAIILIIIFAYIAFMIVIMWLDVRNEAGRR